MVHPFQNRYISKMSYIYIRKSIQLKGYKLKEIKQTVKKEELKVYIASIAKSVPRKTLEKRTKTIMTLQRDIRTVYFK